MPFDDLLDEEEEDPEIERAIMAEVKRRYQEIEEGRAELLDGEEVIAELLMEFGKAHPSVGES